MFKKVFYFALALLMILPLAACTKKYKSVNEYHKDMSKKISEIQDISYDMSTNFADQDIKSKIFIKGDNIRSEVTLQNDEKKFISIQKDGYIISYIPELKMATKRKAGQSETKNPKEWDTEGLENYLLGEKTIKNGYECQMISGQTKNGDREFCVSNKYGILVYANSKIGNSEALVNVTNIKTDKLDESLFELPPGIKIINVAK